MGIYGKRTGITAYVEKLDKPELQRAFLAAIAQRMLAKAALEKAGKREGLAEPALEIVLGRKLLEREMGQTAGKGYAIDPAAFAQGGTMTADVFARLRAEVVRLADSTEPQAINALAEIIPLYAEPKLKNAPEQASSFDAEAVREVLEAG